MIYVCPVCDRESGVTHGDQLWVKETCEECEERTAPMNTVDIQCRGIDTAALEKPIVPLNEWKQYDKLIDITRRAFYTEHSSDFSREKNNGHFDAGPRFKSNYAVMERIVSACPTREFFEANLKAWINAALDDCARADYWYEYEKDYGEYWYEYEKDYGEGAE